MQCAKRSHNLACAYGIWTSSYLRHCGDVGNTVTKSFFQIARSIAVEIRFLGTVEQKGLCYWILLVQIPREQKFGGYGSLRYEV